MIKTIIICIAVTLVFSIISFILGMVVEEAKKDIVIDNLKADMNTEMDILKSKNESLQMSLDITTKELADVMTRSTLTLAYEKTDAIVVSASVNVPFNMRQYVTEKDIHKALKQELMNRRTVSDMMEIIVDKDIIKQEDTYTARIRFLKPLEKESGVLHVH